MISRHALFAPGPDRMPLDAPALESILGEHRTDEPLGVAEHHREYFDQSES